MSIPSFFRDLSHARGRHAAIAAATWLVVAMLAPAPAAAQDSTVTFNVGYFALKGEDGRTERDVLVTNLDFLAFELDDFNGAIVGGEWAVGLGDFLDASVGAGYYKRTVPSVYRDFVDSDGTEIDQDLKLRIVPVTVVARFYPLGRGGGVQPYLGAGVGWLAWRYSETGEFVDTSDFSIFRESYVDSGSAFGPVVLGGVRFSAGNVLIGGEFRYQDATADLDRAVGFADDEIDLGGYSTLFTVGFRF
jgi:outer membrane protein W